jgi:peptidoglycan hydrolase FlgJ
MIDSPSLNASSLNDLPMQGFASTPTDDPEKIKKVAGQFEALLIGQLLKSMRDSEGGWLGTGEDESASSAMEYGQEIFAQAMASKGGLGIANMVTKGLASSKPQAVQE